MPALIAASVFVHGTTNHDCTQGVSSRPNSVACRPRNQRKKLTMGRNSTQFAPLPQQWPANRDLSAPWLEHHPGPATRVRARSVPSNQPCEVLERDSGGFCAKYRFTPLKIDSAI